MNKVKILLPILILIHTNFLHSQQMNCQWLSYSYPGTSYMNDVCIDGNGNAISLGYFIDIYIQGESLSSIPWGMKNIYLCKMDSIGNLVWLKHVGMDGGCMGKSVIVDSHDNIIITGYFADKITICDTTFYDNIGEFIAKFDQDGNCLWVNYVDFIGSFGPLPIVSDEANYIYLLTPGNTIINGYSREGETVITKFNSNGQITWMKPTSITIKETFSGFTNNTVVINSNRIIVGGYYKDTIIFAGKEYISGIEFDIDPYTGDTTYYSSREAMLGIIDASGSEITAIDITAFGSFSLEAVTTNSSKDIYIQGRYYSDTIYFDNDFLNGGNGYLVRYTSDLSLVEAKNIQSLLVYGAASTDNYSYYSSQNWNYMYIVQFDLNCEYIDSIIIGENNGNPEYPRSLSSYLNNDIVLAGSYVHEFWIDSLYAPGEPGSGYKMFVARFHDITTSSNEYNLQEKILVYPNPVSTFLHIDVDDLIKIEIFDMKGTLILEQSLKNKLDCGQLKGGLYLTKIHTSNGVFSRKVIKN